jgi:hypothetical protein
MNFSIGRSRPSLGLIREARQAIQGAGLLVDEDPAVGRPRRQFSCGFGASFARVDGEIERGAFS